MVHFEMMARFPFEMVLWGVRSIFVIAGFLFFLDSLDLKAIFFSSIPDLLSTSLSYISSSSFSFRRPYVDIAVGCVVIILHISSKRYRKPPKERSEKTQNGGELLIERPSLPLLTCHQQIEPSVPASPPQTSRSRSIAYPTEPFPSKGDLLYHHSLKTKMVESFLPVVGTRKHPTMTESRPLQLGPPPSKSKASRELESSARISGKRSMSGDFRSLNEMAVRIGGVGSISCRHTAMETATSRLAREATPVPPNLWKPLPDDQLFLLDDDVDLLEGDFFSAPLLPPPWPGSDSDSGEEREAHDPPGLTSRDITAGRLPKKYDKWDLPELNRETTRRVIMKRSEMFKETRKDPSRRTMNPSKMFSKQQALSSLPWSMRGRKSLEKEELRRRSDAFIKKMRNDMWLEHQKSEQQYRDMISMAQHDAR